MTAASPIGQARGAVAAPAHGVTQREAFRVWIRIALLSFGGPAGQIAVMHRILVDEQRWVSDGRFLHALNYCMLLPGPEATQLATYIGWLMHRTRGGLMAGILFILPGILALMVLSYVYALFGKVGFVTAMFLGLKAAVLAIVLEALFRIGKRALKNGAMLSIAISTFIGIFFLGLPFPLIILAAGALGFAGARAGLPQFAVGRDKGAAQRGGSDGPLLGEAPPAHAKPTLVGTLRVGAIWLFVWLAPVVALLLFAGRDNVFTSIAVFFSKMAVVTFGGAYAVLAYVAQEAVGHYHWLTPGEMLDGLGMAETTPGPLIMVLQFVGFMAALREPGGLPPLLAATLGGLLATWVTFAPCFLWIFVGAPFVEALRGNQPLAGALAAITAAVVGVILNLAVWFAIHTVFRDVIPVAGYGLSFDMPVLASLRPLPAALSLAAMIAMFRFNAGIIATLFACCCAGILFHLLGYSG